MPGPYLIFPGEAANALPTAPSREPTITPEGRVRREFLMKTRGTSGFAKI